MLSKQRFLLREDTVFKSKKEFRQSVTSARWQTSAYDMRGLLPGLFFKVLFLFFFFNNFFMKLVNDWRTYSPDEFVGPFLVLWSYTLLCAATFWTIMLASWLPGKVLITDHPILWRNPLEHVISRLIISCFTGSRVGRLGLMSSSSSKALSRGFYHMSHQDSHAALYSSILDSWGLFPVLK